MGDPITWYALPRTVIDLETIMEAIDAKILTHNQDPSAHGQEGEAVEDHRSEEELDHPYGSVSFRHFLRNWYVLFTCFDSLDGWTLLGNKIAGILNSGIYTGLQVNDAASLRAWDLLQGDIIDYTKNPFFQTTVFIKEVTEQLIHFGCGELVIDLTADSFGFKIEDNTVYAYWVSNGVEFTQAIAGITITERNVYRAEVRSDDEEIDFYINDVLEYTSTANFPVVANYYVFTYSIKTTVAARRYMYFSDLLVEVER